MSFAQLFQPQILQQRDPAFHDVYANHLRIAMTQLDFTLVYGANEDLGVGNIVARDKVAVRISPLAFKVMLLNMQAALEAYEEVVTPLNLPADLANKLAKTRGEMIESFNKKLAEAASAPTE